MIKLYAQPYDISATGFYFESDEAYQAKVEALRNDYGQPVEEFEIQFIDGDGIDAELLEALKVHQGNFARLLEVVDEWDDEEKTKIIIVAREVGERFDLQSGSPDDIEIDLYKLDTMRDLAIQFVEEGLFGEIPKAIENYIDYDAIARDLGMDYGETIVDGQRVIYRAG